MKLDYQKELTPVLYGDSAVKILNEINMPANRLCFGMHWHERMELLLIYSGSICLHIGGKELNAKENSLVIIPPERTHMGISGNDGVRYRTAMFHKSAFYNSSSATDKFLKPIVKISEISELCGFKDASYFTRCFKKRYGMTPTEYSAKTILPYSI